MITRHDSSVHMRNPMRRTTPNTTFLNTLANNLSATLQEHMKQSPEKKTLPTRRRQKWRQKSSRLGGCAGLHPSTSQRHHCTTGSYTSEYSYEPLHEAFCWPGFFFLMFETPSSCFFTTYSTCEKLLYFHEFLYLQGYYAPSSTTALISAIFHLTNISTLCSNGGARIKSNICLYT